MYYYISDIDNVANDAPVIRVDIDFAINAIKPYKLLYTDTETVSLNYHHPNPLRLLQIGTGKDVFIFYTQNIVLGELKDILEDPKVIKIVVNKYFEIGMLKSIGVNLKGSFDLSLAFACYRMGKNLRTVSSNGHDYYIYSFAGMYKELLDIDIDKQEQSSFIRDNQVYTKEQIIYAARDVEIQDLYETIKDRCIKIGILHPDFNMWMPVREQLKLGILKFVSLEMIAADGFAEMVYNGIRMDVEAWMLLNKSNKLSLIETERDLNIKVAEAMPKRLVKIEPIQDTVYTQYNLFGEPEEKEGKKVDKHRINWNSSKQVGPLIKEIVGFLPKNQKGEETTSAKELKKVLNTQPDNVFVKLLLKRSTTAKMISSFGRAFIEKFIHPTTKRVHTRINQVLETGRVAWFQPNLAQIPGKKEYRDCFIPAEGYDIVACDYSAQESRTMAYLANDVEFIDFFANGDGDSHSMIASKVMSSKYGIDIVVGKHRLSINAELKTLEEVTKLGKELYPKADIIKRVGNSIVFETSNEDNSNPLRQAGKILNFFISFGGSAYTLSREQAIPKEEAKTLIDGYWNSFGGLKDYFDTEKKLALKNGYIIAEPITNTIRHLPSFRELRIVTNKLNKEKKALIDMYGVNKAKQIYFKQLKEPGSEFKFYNSQIRKITGDIERVAMNTRIQTTASRMTKLALILIEEDRIKYNLDMKPILTVHDEILYEVRERTEYEEIIQNRMEEASIILIGVAIPAKPAKGKIWIH